LLSNCPYLNNVVEQDHRAIKRRVNASQGFRSFDGAWRTIQLSESEHVKFTVAGPLVVAAGIRSLR
jgi:transposase-like protein